MLNHDERVATAREVVAYLASRTPQEMSAQVPNCPGWTVRNALVHVGRVGIAWRSMMLATPEDPDSRVRGYAEADLKPEGASADEVASWAYSALDVLHGDVDRLCYFSMSGGSGTVGDWAWHCSTELSIHRLDVESALDQQYSMTDAQAIDAISYSCELFLPAFRRVTESDPGALRLQLLDAAGSVIATDETQSDAGRSVVVRGPAVEVLLAMWGRANVDVEVVHGDPGVLSDWAALPSRAFQFGTWE